MAAAALREGLEELASDAGDFWVPTRVVRIDRPITALEFLREYVQPNVPVILGPGSGLLDSWPALYHWQNWAYVKNVIGADTLVTVNATPNGRGDAIVDVERSGYPLIRGPDSDTHNGPQPPHGQDNGTDTPPPPPPFVFVKPEPRRMRFGDFIDALVAEGEGGGTSAKTEVLYLSQQDDSLRKEFPMLCHPSPSSSGVHVEKREAAAAGGGFDIDSRGFPLACEAFGNSPDAVNFWIGDSRAVSSFHRDPYENTYAVIVGEKHFALLPPCDAWALPEAPNLPQAHFRRRRRQHHPTTHDPSDPAAVAAGGAPPPPPPEQEQEEEEAEGFEVVMEPTAERIAWIDLEVELDDEGQPTGAPENKRRWRPQHAPQRGRWRGEGSIHPVECYVRQGEVLYLPALWYHRVTQTCPTIAVNFWHDMRFDCRYVYTNFVGRMGRALRALEEEDEAEEEGEEKGM